MRNVNSRILTLAGATVFLILTLALLYQQGMSAIENRPRTFLQSLEFVLQTMTTVGYGQDAPWDSSLMIALVMFTEVAGIFLVLISVPVVLGPWFKERFQVRPPTGYRDAGDHVVLTRHSNITESLMEVFADHQIPHVLIEPDEDVGRELYKNHRSVIAGDPFHSNCLQKARIDEAQLLILDGTDQFLATVALAAQEEHPDLRILAVSEERKRFDHLRSAGIDSVFYPHELIGETLAHKILAALGKHVEVGSEVRDHLEIEEFPVFPDSSLAGKTLTEADIRRNTGCHVVGIWREGQFRSSPDPDVRINEHDILVVAGTRANLEGLSERTEIRSTIDRGGESKVVIVGYGNEGRAAHHTLSEHGIDPFIINDKKGENVDLVGDGMNPELLRKAGIEKASFLLVTVSDDEVAIMVTLIARKLNPSLEILTQVHEASSREVMYRAGANYVQALDRVSSQLIGEEVLGEDLLTYRMNITIQEVDAGSLAGKTLKDMGDGPDRTLTVLAVKRGDTMHTGLSPEFRVREDDQLFVVGTEEEVDRFRSAVE